MSYTVTEESFSTLASYWKSPDHLLKWDLVFSIPCWLEVWWREFQPESELYVRAVREQADIIGIASLQVKGTGASFVGSADVCDYMDFVVVPGRETDFFNVLLDDLKQRGITHLDLRSLRPDSTVLTDLVAVAEGRQYEVLCQPEDVSVELDLPATWEEYLAALTAKQRHEVKRKIRRLDEAGEVSYRSVKGGAATDDALEIFLSMFAESRSDKAEFLTERRESFFRSMVGAMCSAELLKLGILELDALPVAIIMCFDYNDSTYLYNSGYEPKYGSLSVGLLSKALCIQESIREGKKTFDFLKGEETYKYRLGGKAIPLSSCQIKME